MSDPKTPEPTVTVRRIEGARRVEHAAAGSLPAFEFGPGDGPWTMSEPLWLALALYIDDAFVVITDGNPNPASDELAHDKE